MAEAKRRVSVRRKTEESLNKGLETARFKEALEKQRVILDGISAEATNAAKVSHGITVTAEKALSHDEGMVQGRALELQDYETKLDESVENRLCDNTRDLPWPVGVMMAGEQHRILQALAEYLAPAKEWRSNYEVEILVQGFARELGIAYCPMNLDAPSAVTFRNCDEPPKHIDRDQQGKQIQIEDGEARLPGYTEHWKYYLRQLEDGTG